MVHNPQDDITMTELEIGETKEVKAKIYYLHNLHPHPNDSDSSDSESNSDSDCTNSCN